jgi:crossover junction endodeoxyribonuclease RusA
MTYSFVIPGKPIVQQRPRKSKQGHFYDPSAKEKKELGRQLWLARSENGKGVLTGDLKLYVSFYGCGGKCDLDNLIKAFSDAANGILWEDDRQIVRIYAQMVRKDPQPRTHAIVRLA